MDATIYCGLADCGTQSNKFSQDTQLNQDTKEAIMAIIRKDD
jgi:hypothetical protein